MKRLYLTPHSDVFVAQNSKGQNLYIFKSYNTFIACYNEATGKLVLTNYWDYSVTTMQQLRKFLKNFTDTNLYYKADIEQAINKLDVSVISCNSFINRYIF